MSNTHRITVACLSAIVAAAAMVPVQAQSFVRLEDRALIELRETKGFLNLNGVWTIEMWIRLRNENTGTVSLIGDNCWGNMLPKKPIAEAAGWTLRLTPVKNINQRSIDLTIAGTRPGKKKIEWIRLVTPPLTVPEKPEWSHVAIVKQLGGTAIFVNGQPLVAQSTLGVQFHPAPTNLFLGLRRHMVGTRVSDADYGALRITERVRYTRKFKPQPELQKDGRTVLLLDFNVGQGDTIPDVAGGNHHGVIDGGEWLKES